MSKPSIIKPLIFIVIAFILSRIIFFYAGIHFDASPLTYFYQYIDPDLLRSDLFQSIYYLHIQPPLYNLFLGFILKLFQNNETIAFNFVYIFLGLLLAVTIFLIMSRLGVSTTLSTIITVLFIVSPSCILYENWLFYTYPLTVLLCLSALFLHKFLSSASIWDEAVFFLLLSSITLTTSFFNILLLILFILVIVFFQRHNWKRVIFALCIPFLLSFLWYTKNMYMFGSFTSSTWFGTNLSKITTFMLPMDERILLAHNGKISGLSLITPFSNLTAYQAHLPRIQKTNIPVLDQEVKSSNHTNLNNIAYINISKQYLSDAVYVLTSYPEAYLNGLISSYFIYFLPSTDYFFLANNRKHIQYLDTFYNTVFYGQLARHTGPPFKKPPFSNIGLLLVIGFFVSVFYGWVLIHSSFARKSTDLPFAITILFLWINVLYVTIVGNFFEMGENNRFRFMIDPFLLIILGLFLDRKFKTFRLSATRGLTVH